MDRPDQKNYDPNYFPVSKYIRECEAYMDQQDAEAKFLATRVDHLCGEVERLEAKLQASNERVKELELRLNASTRAP